jgi:hypothetical protein
VLGSTRSSVVSSSVADAGEMAFGSAIDGGPSDAESTDASSSEAGDGGPSTTLYQRLGSHAGVRAAIDKIVQAELGDPKIASFFFNQVATPVPAGHPTVDQLSECFTDLLANAAGGPETYPTTVADEAGTFTCRNLAVIHQPLDISGGTFDTFVMIAATELGTLGVAAADIQTIGSVLASTRSDIVSPSGADAGEMAYDAGND